MAERRQLLNEALNIGRRELGSLIDGDVFEADRLAQDRERLLDQAIADLGRDDLQSLADELVEMKNLHAEITSQARKLHASLKHDLLNMRKQNRRFSGYSRGAGNMPSLARDRFISKLG